MLANISGHAFVNTVKTCGHVVVNTVVSPCLGEVQFYVTLVACPIY